MTSEKIERPGETIPTTLAALLNVTESSPAVDVWNQRMREIEASERSAENDAASIRLR
jgi:hypothetical protein